MRIYSEDVNTIEYNISGDKEIIYISKVDSNGYEYYEICGI